MALGAYDPAVGTPIYIRSPGITEVHCPVGESLVDMVFVNGFDRSSTSTWTADQSNIFWPSQLLPDVLQKQKVRILIFRCYTTIESLLQGYPEYHMNINANILIETLGQNRAKRRTLSKPIIFVAHGLGGNIVRQALALSWNFPDVSQHRQTFLY